LLLVGHGTALQVLEKKGNVLVALTAPLKPALHAQPAGTLAPLLLVGHVTAVHPLLKKGGVVVAVTVPL